MITPFEYQKKFLDAIDDEDIKVLKEMLDAQQITLESEVEWTHNGDRIPIGSHWRQGKLVDIALYRLADNLAAVKLLVNDYKVSPPPHFLTLTTNTVVMAHLMKNKKADPYRELPHHFREIGETLTHLTGVTIIKIIPSYLSRIIDVRLRADYTLTTTTGYQAPHIICASSKEARILINYLKVKCGLKFYKLDTSEGNGISTNFETLGSSCQLTDLIRQVREKMALWKEPESKHYPSQLTMFGPRSNKATGPRVLESLKNMQSHSDYSPADVALVADQFLRWAKAKNRHFNSNSMHEISSTFKI